MYRDLSHYPSHYFFCLANIFYSVSFVSVGILKMFSGNKDVRGRCLSSQTTDELEFQSTHFWRKIISVRVPSCLCSSLSSSGYKPNGFASDKKNDFSNVYGKCIH